MLIFVLQACWSRGIQASQTELNRWLFNARKSKKIGRIRGVVPYRVPRSAMEAYEFASEVGARLLQDIVFDEEARWISLDDILCDPKLGRRFHSIAQSITPGYQELDYRWAALSIRKAMNRKVAAKNIPRPEFSSLGVADGVSAESVPDCAGFFWLRSAGVDFYIGHANNLREKVSAMADVELRHRIPVRSSQLPFDSEPLEYLIAAAPEMPVSHRFEVKKRVVSENLPRLNITKEMDRLVA